MDELMLQLARAGDSAAFETLVTPSESRLWRLCWHYTRNTEDASDCLQETMVHAWQSLGSFRGECPLEAWLYRICVRCCLDFLRKKSRRVQAEIPLDADAAQEPASPEDTETAVLDRAYREALYEAVDSLPPDQREMLILTQIEGVSYEDAAGLTGTGIGTVKSRVSRAREKLKKKMAGWREQSEVSGVIQNERRSRT